MSQFEETSSKLVMSRFFRALKEENLMAAELWASHPMFDQTPVGPKHDYYRHTFAKLFDGYGLTMTTVEWLLTYAKGMVHDQPGFHFFCPGGEYLTGRRRSGNNWRGHLCDKGRRWMRDPEKMGPETKRCLKLIFELGWLRPPGTWLDSSDGRILLLDSVPSAMALDITLTERSEYVGGKYIRQPINLSMIDLLQERHQYFDLSYVGDELVREYCKDPAGRKLVLRLIKHRDRDKPMPEAFTKFLQSTLQAYKTYQMLYEDSLILSESKTGETQ